MKPKKRLQACILCPQRLFKNDKMVEDHVKSKVSLLSLTFPILDRVIELKLIWLDVSSSRLQCRVTFDPESGSPNASSTQIP
jgi:hypothetical protein